MFKGVNPFSIQPDTLKKDKKMGKYKENPKYNVVSIRVSDEERKVIRKLAVSSNLSTANLLREILFRSGLLSGTCN